MKRATLLAACLALFMQFNAPAYGAQSSAGSTVAAEQAAQANVSRDARNRIERIEYPDGNKVREFSYAGKSNEINKVVITEKSTGTVRTFTYSGSGDEWLVTDANGWQTGTWHGQLRLSADGVYSFTDGSADLWLSYDLDGNQFREYIGKGVRARYDDEKHLVRVALDNGRVLEGSYDQSQLIKLVDKSSAKTTVWSRQSDGKWTSGSLQEVRLDVSFDRNGAISWRAAGDDFTHILSAEGKTLLQMKNGSICELGDDGKPAKVTGAHGQTREFEYANGQLTKVTSRTKDGTATVWQAGGTGADSRRNLTVLSGGDVQYEGDQGEKITERSDFSSTVVGKDGQLLEVRLSNGSKRTFTYSGKELDSVTDSRKTAGGERVDKWTRKHEADGSLAAAIELTGGGKTRTLEFVGVTADGDLQYKDESGAARTAKISRLKVSVGFQSEDIEEAHASLIDAMALYLSDEHLARLEKHMIGFESRMADLAYMKSVAGIDAKKARQACARTVAAAYDHLTEMIKSDPAGAFFDHKTRVHLVETFLFHAWDPTASDQGYTGTCWIHSGHIAGGMVGHADHLARLIKEVSLTGKYETLNGGESGGNAFSMSFSKSLFDGMFTGSESKWDMDQARTDGNVRSPVGLMLDQILPVIGGRPENASNMGNYWGSGGTRNIMYMVTGDVVYDELNLINGSERETLLRKGALISYLPGHMRSRQLRRDGDEWIVIQDDQMGDANDRVIERIKDLKKWLSGN